MENALHLTRPVTRITLRQWLLVDALTCVITGLAFVFATRPLAVLFGLPDALLTYAGLVLFPCAALMLLAARILAKPLVWTIVAGNYAWALGSIVVAFALEPTSIGLAFTVAQALVVAALGWFEQRAAR
jgi:hypothetical protein